MCAVRSCQVQIKTRKEKNIVFEQSNLCWNQIHSLWNCSHRHTLIHTWHAHTRAQSERIGIDNEGGCKHGKAKKFSAISKRVAASGNFVEKPALCVSKCKRSWSNFQLKLNEFERRKNCGEAPLWGDQAEQRYPFALLAGCFSLSSLRQYIDKLLLYRNVINGSSFFLSLLKCCRFVWKVFRAPHLLWIQIVRCEWWIWRDDGNVIRFHDR